MIALNYFHYISLGFIFIIFIFGMRSAFKQKNTKLILPMVFSVVLITGLLAVLAVVIVDKYTKDVKLYKLDSKRLLSIEKVVYTGVVKNEGDFPIGEVVFELKLVNGAHAIGSINGNTIYKPSSFFDLFSEGKGVLYKPQSIVKRFVVAKNLKPKASKSFRVYFDYPPYFRNVSAFPKVKGR